MFIINLQQVRSLRVKEQEVFLDSDNLTDLRQLLVHIADSDCIALLHTAVRSSAAVFPNAVAAAVLLVCH